jgi:hypothetical protein
MPDDTLLTELAAAVAKSQKLARDMSDLQERIAALTKRVTENAEPSDKKKRR